MERLTANVRLALEKMGFKKLTEIQDKTLGLARAKRDFWATSPTGTGKTAAFLVPLIENAAANPRYKALVLEPSRELVIQVANDSRKIAQNTAVRTLAAYGGTNTEIQHELGKTTQIIIATPERALELLEKTINPNEIQTLVLDEADRLFSVQFKRHLDLIAKLVSRRHTMLFSVHAPKTLEEKARHVLSVKEFAHAKTAALPETQILHEFVVAKNKANALANLLAGLPGKTIAFFGTVDELQQTAQELSQNKIHALSLNSKRSAHARNNAVKNFRQQPSALLLTTDLAARGMHFPEVNQIFALGVPPQPEFYLHRAGRTGRMGARGKITTILSHDEEKPFLQLCAALGITPKKIQ